MVSAVKFLSVFVKNFFWIHIYNGILTFHTFHFKLFTKSNGISILQMIEKPSFLNRKSEWKKLHESLLVVEMF